MPRLLSTLRVPELMEEERALLDDLVRAGSGLLAAMGGGGGALAQRGDAAARFLYRRWVLEILVLLRVRGALGFNELARALGDLPGESLAPKLQELERAGLVERRELPARPRRTVYSLAREGEALASGVYVLTVGKAEHARAVQEGRGRVPVHVDAAPAPAGEVAAALARFSDLARKFTELHAVRDRGQGLEEGLATARRFAAACVHKWHGPALFTLATRGPLRFRELRDAVGAGDQALANALRELVEEFQAVERLGPAREARYGVTALGRFDLGLGAPLALLVPERALALQAP